MYTFKGICIFFQLDAQIKSCAPLNFLGDLDSMCKTPPLFLKFVEYVIYMIHDEIVKNTHHV